MAVYIHNIYLYVYYEIIYIYMYIFIEKKKMTDILRYFESSSGPCKNRSLVKKKEIGKRLLVEDSLQLCLFQFKIRRPAGVSCGSCLFVVVLSALSFVLV